MIATFGLSVVGGAIIWDSTVVLTASADWLAAIRSAPARTAVTLGVTWVKAFNISLFRRVGEKPLCFASSDVYIVGMVLDP